MQGVLVDELVSGRVIPYLGHPYLTAMPKGIASKYWVLTYKLERQIKLISNVLSATYNNERVHFPRCSMLFDWTMNEN